MATIDIETKDVTEPRRFVTLHLTEVEAREVMAAMIAARSYLELTYTAEEAEAHRSPLYKLLRDTLDGKPKAPPSFRPVTVAPKKRTGWFL